MSYILKRCGSAGGLQSFVQQCIFSGASHEQEPYMAQDRKRETEREREAAGGVWVRSEGVMKW